MLELKLVFISRVYIMVLFLDDDYPISGLSANSRIYRLIHKKLSKIRISTPFLSIVDKYHHFWASRNTWTLICTSGYDIDWFWPQTSVKRYNCTHVCYPSGILLPRSLFWIFWWKFQRAGNLRWIFTHHLFNIDKHVFIKPHLLFDVWMAIRDLKVW